MTLYCHLLDIIILNDHSCIFSSLLKERNNLAYRINEFECDLGCIITVYDYIQLFGLCKSALEYKIR